TLAQRWCRSQLGAGLRRRHTVGRHERTRHPSRERHLMARVLGRTPDARRPPITAPRHSTGHPAAADLPGAVWQRSQTGLWLRRQTIARRCGPITTDERLIMTAASPERSTTSAA